MNIPLINSHYKIPNDKVELYRENGHVLLPNICSGKEISSFREKIRKTSYQQFPEMPLMDDRPKDDFSRAFIQTFNLHEHDPSLEEFCLSPRFGKIAADLMGVNSVRLYYNKPMFKEPSSWITPWHQDGPHWPITSNNMLTMWVALVDITMEMGPIRFASKTHKDKYFGPRGITKNSESFYHEYIENNQCNISEMPLKAGDATIHNHWTIHGAGPNKTQSMREVIGITMYEDGLMIDQTICQADLTMMPDSEKEREIDIKVKKKNIMSSGGVFKDGIVRDPYFGGRIHGEIADSDRNPVLFDYGS